MKPRNRRPKCGSKKVSFVPGRFHQSSGTFLAEILEVGPFQVVTTDNGANIDFMDADGEITPQH